MMFRYAVSLPRTLPNCTRLKKKVFNNLWRQYSTRQGMLSSLQQTPYSQCAVTVSRNRGTFEQSLSPHFSFPVRSITSPALSHVVYQPFQRRSLANARTILFHSPCFPLMQSRNFSSRGAPNTSTVRYIIATAIVVLGLSYAAVPLYRLFCQASGYGGTVTKVEAGEKVEKMEPIRERSIVVRFPYTHTHVKNEREERTKDCQSLVVPGETALAFYTARNPTDKPVTGISTYNVVPFDAGQYFNKIQCFCFEEQILNPNEQVDMPVFFYIDPEFNDDPAMARVTSLTLSYTFFEAKEGQSIYIPVPQVHQKHV